MSTLRLRPGDGFMLDETPYGTRFSVTASYWNPAFTEYILLNKISSLRFQPTWWGEDVGFLSGLSSALTSIEITNHNSTVTGVAVVNGLHLLKKLYLSVEEKVELDFSCFSFLEECGLFWDANFRNLSSCKNLKILAISKYKKATLIDLDGLSELRSLTVLDSRVVSEVDLLAQFQKLQCLSLAYLTKLDSLQGVEGLTGLENLELNTCKKISSLANMETLENLRVLRIDNCGDIDSIKFAEKLLKLEEFSLIESTNILDGNLNGLKRLPRLRKILFRERGHYSQTRESLKSYVSR